MLCSTPRCIRGADEREGGRRGGGGGAVGWSKRGVGETKAPEDTKNCFARVKLKCTLLALA